MAPDQSPDRGRHPGTSAGPQPATAGVRTRVTHAAPAQAVGAGHQGGWASRESQRRQVPHAPERGQRPGGGLLPQRAPKTSETGHCSAAGPAPSRGGVWGGPEQGHRVTPLPLTPQEEHFHVRADPKAPCPPKRAEAAQGLGLPFGFAGIFGREETAGMPWKSSGGSLWSWGPLAPERPGCQLRLWGSPRAGEGRGPPSASQPRQGAGRGLCSPQAGSPMFPEHLLSTAPRAGREPNEPGPAPGGCGRP